MLMNREVERVLLYRAKINQNVILGNIWVTFK